MEKSFLVGAVFNTDRYINIEDQLDDIYHNLPPTKGTVSHYMSKKVVTVDSTMDVVEAANLFLNSNFRRYPVITDGKIVGLISRRDILIASKSIKKTSW